MDRDALAVGPNTSGEAKAPASNLGASNITYRGGPIMTGTTHAYIIWYGDWSGNTATTIIPAFLSSIGGSPYFGINTTYYNSSNVHVTNAVTLAGQTTDSYSQGTTLSDAQVQSVVSSAISANKLPKDTNGVYFVLTSQDVNESSGFCTQYCGWHTHGTISGSDIKYSFVGTPSHCISPCYTQSTSPNGNADADGMVSIIAHELEETVTDPDINAWYDSQGYENADKCAWIFGPTSTAANGSQYNVTLGGKQYLVQENWIAPASGCAMAICSPGETQSCCAYSQCGCIGDKTCNANGQWGTCVGSTPKGSVCP